MANLLEFKEQDELKKLPKFPKLISRTKRYNRIYPQKVIEKLGAYYEKTRKIEDRKELEYPFSSKLTYYFMTPVNEVLVPKEISLTVRNKAEYIAFIVLKKALKDKRDVFSIIKEMEQDGQKEMQNESYKRKSEKTYASVNQLKIYQDEEMNKSSKFREYGFSDDIEIDTEKYQGEEFDKLAYKRFEKEWGAVWDKLPQPAKKPSFKIRKLGRHKASGLYYPTLNILAVDVRDTTAMVHEWGHALDFENSTHTPYSEMREFQSILEHYTRNLAIPEGVTKSRDYWTTPTEVFARAFEMYANEKGWISENIAHMEAYDKGWQYAPYKAIMSEVVAYMDSIFQTKQTEVA